MQMMRISHPEKEDDRHTEQEREYGTSIPHHLILFKHVAELFNANFNRLYHELGTVIALQQESVKLRVLLRHEEGLFSLPIFKI